MPIKRKKKPTTSHEINKRLAIIRQQNVERHAGQESRNLLRDKIIRHQNNETFRMEKDRLVNAALKGTLGRAGEKRLEHLKEIIIK